MSRAVIRRALAADAEELTGIVQSSTAYQGTFRSIIAGYRVSPRYVEENLVFLATHERNVLGFYSLVVCPPELDLIFVRDSARGQGVGQLLMTHLRTQALGAGLTAVRIVSHPPAEPFYLACGARRIGTVDPTPPKISWPRPELLLGIEPVLDGEPAAHGPQIESGGL